MLSNEIIKLKDTGTVASHSDHHVFLHESQYLVQYKDDVEPQHSNIIITVEFKAIDCKSELT